ncbi:Rabenosyn Rab binding domain, partial [Rhizoctonia solani]
MNGTATPVTVSYRPYQSKRHSRNSSGLGSSAGFSPPVTPPARSPGPYESPSTPEHRVYGNTKYLAPHHQTTPTVTVPSRSSPSPSPSPSPTTPEATQAPNPIETAYKSAITQSQAPDTQTLPTPSPTPEQPASTESSSQPTSPLTQLPALPASRPGSETAGPSSPGPSSPTSSTAPSPRPAIVQRPGSRFRVVSTRGLSANTQPARPSPLRPASHLSPGPSTPTAPTHTRTLSNVSTPVSPSPVPKLPASVSAPVPFNERLSPGNRNKPLPAPGSVVSAPSLTPPRSNTPSAPPRSTTPILTPVPAPRSTTPVAAPSPTSNTPVPYAVLSRASSASPIPTNTLGVNSPSRPAPYRAGFQPKGVYRHRTEEFEAARAKKVDGKRTEEKRLTRRLEKLIDLHFSPKEKDDAPPPPNRRSSSFFDDLAELKNKSPNELWRGVVESKAAQQERAIRTAEQTITKWEDDKDVSACPICTRTSFHPLTNRKHHCRLCGRVVCSLPPKPPTRPISCSLLIVADPRTRMIEEVPDVIAYGVTLDGEKDNKYVKGVRICRTCRAVVSKQQYNIEAVTIPAFSRIYQALLRLEGQIEDDLPQFQELVLNLKNGTHSNPSVTSTTAAARKSLLDRFHEYDRLAKRLRALPCQPGSSQEKVQMAVSTRANVFLQKHMFPLQTLPKMKQLAKAATESELAEPDPVLDDPGHAIQPLLEQEAVLEQMLAEAQAARKIEDAQTLKANLTEIRNEIRRFMR